jgi:hypothetical protein
VPGGAARVQRPLAPGLNGVSVTVKRLAFASMSGHPMAGVNADFPADKMGGDHVNTESLRSFISNVWPRI